VRADLAFLFAFVIASASASKQNVLNES